MSSVANTENHEHEDKNGHSLYIRRVDNHEPHSMSGPAIVATYKTNNYMTYCNNGIIWRTIHFIALTQEWMGADVKVPLKEHIQDPPITEDRINTFYLMLRSLDRMTDNSVAGGW